MPFADYAIDIIRIELFLMEPRLVALRDQARQWGQHPDWPWNGFVLSYATLGGSANWESRIRPAYEDLFAWSVLSALPTVERYTRLEQVGNSRYNARVSVWLRQSYDRVAATGGPSAVRQQYIELETAKDRIRLIRSFPGFGEKYGRNIPMDIHDNLVREHFALDHRLKTVLADCGFEKVTYKDGERILRQLANVLGTDAWTLDRVIYVRFEQIRKQLALSKTT